MSAVASQITSLTSVYSNVYLRASQRKHTNSVSMAFVRGIHHKGPVTRKVFPFDDAIMCLLKNLCHQAPTHNRSHCSLTKEDPQAIPSKFSIAMLLLWMIPFVLKREVIQSMQLSTFRAVNNPKAGVRSINPRIVMKGFSFKQVAFIFGLLNHKCITCVDDAHKGH